MLAFNDAMVCGLLTMSADTVEIVDTVEERWYIDEISLAMGADAVAESSAEVKIWYSF